jgi:hypothetical protein
VRPNFVLRVFSATSPRTLSLRSHFFWLCRDLAGMPATVFGATLSPMLAELASDAVIDAAYAWLIRQRRDWPADTDIWHLRFGWTERKPRLQAELREGSYRFAPMERVTKSDGEIVHVWSSCDALVLKALAMVLAKVVPVSERCTHVKGHGGAKAAVRVVRASLGRHAFVMRASALETAPRGAPGQRATCRGRSGAASRQDVHRARRESGSFGA